MNKDLIAKQSVIINASPESVWYVLTNPEKIKLFLFGTQTETDWKVGSPISFTGAYNGQTYHDKGNVLKCDVNSHLSYNYWSGFSGLADSPENYSLVSYDIEKLDDGSIKFTWTQKGFSSEEGKCHTENGLVAMLEQIKTLAEA